MVLRNGLRGGKSDGSVRPSVPVCLRRRHRGVFLLSILLLYHRPYYLLKSPSPPFFTVTSTVERAPPSPSFSFHPLPRFSYLC